MMATFSLLLPAAPRTSKAQKLPKAQKAQKVTLETSDGLKLTAEWHKPKGKVRGAIVALHMYKSNKKAWEPLVAPSLAEGVAVLAVDLRGHGGSARQGKVDLAPKVEARDPALFAAMKRDAAAAVAFVKKAGIPPAKIVLAGASVGCSIALHYAASDPAIRGAFLLTPGKKYLGLDSLVHARKWGKRPLLLVASKDETPKGARPIFDALDNRSHAVVLQLPQADIHGTKMFGKVKGIEHRLAEWVALQLGRKPDR
jgi:pimeloyl-ACP methyl ester carboxylesterase